MCDNANSEQDPWLNTLVDNTIKLEFEDKFVPKLKNEFKPLDDSLSYIANLERKLLKLKTGSKNKKKELLQAAEKTCSSYMLQMISSESRETLNINQDPDLEKSLNPHVIHSWLNPEQALTVGELAELLQNDNLG